MYCAKVDPQRHVQEGRQHRLRDLSRVWGRCDGGCRPEHRAQAATAGGWWRGSSKLKAPGL